MHHRVPSISKQVACLLTLSFDRNLLFHGGSIRQAVLCVNTMLTIDCLLIRIHIRYSDVMLFMGRTSNDNGIVTPDR
ncbi:MAG TPA: hypothetical protein DDY17_07795 [Syntrophaceae bacterium]|nr:hypothetical protein [Syntrophaceae bacterium]